MDESLCFGWIDGVRRSLDDESYVIRFTPRKPRSTWSAVNIKRVEELTALGRMRPAGLAVFAKRAEDRSGIYSYEQGDGAHELAAADEQRLFLALAQRTSLALENARLYEQARHTALLEERQQLARELHDAVTQTLFSSSLIADVLPRLWERDPGEARRRLEELGALTRGALAEMRTLLYELRPTALTEAPLGDLLRQLVEATSGRTRLPVSLTVDGQRPLPPDVQIALYRIAQEALKNVAKHARAGRADLALVYRAHDVKLCVRDDGQGFDLGHRPPGHLGVGIMRERAATVGAGLAIESQPGHGTRVTVTWPANGRSGEDD